MYPTNIYHLSLEFNFIRKNGFIPSALNGADMHLVCKTRKKEKGKKKG